MAELSALPLSKMVTNIFAKHINDHINKSEKVAWLKFVLKTALSNTFLL